MVEDPSSVSRPLPSADLTPERTRSCTSAVSSRSGDDAFRRNTALIFAGTAMVLGILWVNSGTSQQASNRDLTAPGRAAQERRDIVAGKPSITLRSRRSRPLGAGDAIPTHRCSIPQQGFLALTVRSSLPCSRARPTGGTGARPIWPTRRDGRHSSPMAGAISVGSSQGPAAGLPANRPKIQERQGVRRAGRPMRWICCGKAQP
jgi:type IV secretion system protein VirB10